MTHLGVAMDLGTSGIRAHGVELETGAILSTVLSLAHPLPGGNVMDHLHFAIQSGVPVARSILITAINRMIQGLAVPMSSIRRFAVCGNPVQLSLLQGIEVRDLAYSGKRKLAELGIKVPDRDGTIITAGDVEGLLLPENCQIIIPPTISHTVGADGLAMILQSGILKKRETALITDYGTNAEMALCHDGRIITASASAGPAIEGQQISCGITAGPGAVTDLQPGPSATYCTVVLDDHMVPVRGPHVDLHRPGAMDKHGVMIKGITGTGVVAVLYEAIRSDHVALPRIQTPDGLLHLVPGIYLDKKDLKEAGKAVGAIRAGHITLCHEAGIGYGEVKTVYMAGAAGTFVDPVKAQGLGLLPPRAESVIQVGNTSLMMAVTLVTDPGKFKVMQDMAHRIRDDHCMLSESETFKKLFILELAYWGEGMPMDVYRSLLAGYGLKDIPLTIHPPDILRPARRDIPEYGRLGLRVIDPVCQAVSRPVEGCTACGACVRDCPQSALALNNQRKVPEITLDPSRCAGISCKRCEQVCVERVMNLDDYFSSHKGERIS